jgi:methionyl-tRNA formyltransferase
MAEQAYIVAGCKPWNRKVFDEKISPLPGRWHFIDSKEQLTTEFLSSIKPRYIFFLHWSWLVPEEIFSACDCVCFHMADVPFGRGGSPLQNLILLGLKETRLTALKMVRELDAGPVYLKVPMSLSGSAEEIYIRSSVIASKMIERIIDEEMEPAPQIGEVTEFARRTPDQSEIPEISDLDKLYDFIRMLDADGYPRAFLEYKGYRFEFSKGSLKDGELEATVKVVKQP